MSGIELSYAPPAEPALRRWLNSNAARAAFALSDQAVVSAGNFATNLILLRMLPQQAMGAFGVLMDMMLFLNSLQSAMVTYPLQLTGAKIDGPEFRKLSSGFLILTILFSIPLLCVMAGFGGAISKSLSIALTAGIALAVWQVQETLRRALMAQMHFGKAVFGDAIRYCGQPVLLLLMIRTGRLDLPIVFAGLGLMAGLGALVQAWQVGLERFSLRELLPLAKDAWRHGRWALASCLTTLVTANSFSWVLGLTFGLAEVAKFQAIGAVMKLTNPLMQGIAGFITPAVSRAHARNDAHAAARSALKFGALGAAMLLPYFLALAFFPMTSLRIFCGKNNPYMTDSVVWALRIYVINYALIYVSCVLNAVLNGLSQSRYGFYAQVVNIIVTACIAMPLVYFFGLKGVVLGGLSCVAVWTASHAWFLKQVIHREASSTR